MPVTGRYVGRQYEYCMEIAGQLVRGVCALLTSATNASVTYHHHPKSQHTLSIRESIRKIWCTLGACIQIIAGRVEGIPRKVSMTLGGGRDNQGRCGRVDRDRGLTESLAITRKPFQSPVAFAMSLPTFPGHRPRGPILGARAGEILIFTTSGVRRWITLISLGSN